MAYFVIEINIYDTTQTGAKCDMDSMASIIESVGGRLIDANISDHLNVVSLIVEAESEITVVDFLKSQAIEVERIKHVFLLKKTDTEDENSNVEASSYVGFFGLKELLNTLAIEVYPG